VVSAAAIPRPTELELRFLTSSQKKKKKKVFADSAPQQAGNTAWQHIGHERRKQNFPAGAIALRQPDLLSRLRAAAGTLPLPVPAFPNFPQDSIFQAGGNASALSVPRFNGQETLCLLGLVVQFQTISRAARGT